LATFSFPLKVPSHLQISGRSTPLPAPGDETQLMLKLMDPLAKESLNGKHPTRRKEPGPTLSQLSATESKESIVSPSKFDPIDKE
jgi:hypothetical protein